MTSLLPVIRSGAAKLLSPGTDPTPAARRGAGATRRFAARALPWLARGMVAVAVVAFAGLVVGPHAFGYRTMTMLSASMSPSIDPGDITIVTPLAISDVEPGMVIAYHIPVDDHRLVTHRVVSVEHGPDGAVTVQTKGDANEAADPWTATLRGDTAYQVRAVIPEIGSVIQALRTPVIAESLTYGATALVAGWLLLAIWRPSKQEEDRA
jgi:signal peptidase I